MSDVPVERDFRWWGWLLLPLNVLGVLLASPLLLLLWLGDE